jgi:uncharacterized protein DUF6286
VTVVNRVLATLLALALFLGGLLATVDVVLVQLQRPPFLVPVAQWASWFRVQTLGAGIVRAVCAGLVLLGLFLLFCALRRGKPGALPLPGRTEGVRVTASRKELERALSAEAGRVDGVESARAHARRRRVTVQARTALRDPGDLSTRVTEVVSGRLGELGLTDRLTPRVTVSSKGTR